MFFLVFYSTIVLNSEKSLQISLLEGDSSHYRTEADFRGDSQRKEKGSTMEKVIILPQILF